ncbi:MAG: ISAs1 family transposase [Aquiluna sp.]
MTLIKTVKQISDHRDNRGKKHPLWMLLLIVLRGDLCGYRGYRPLESFCKLHWQSLQRLMGIPEGASVPSYSTSRRLQIHIAPDQWELLYTQWSVQTCPQYPVSLQYAIDGKSIRCTSTRGQDRGHNYFSVVSVYNAQIAGVLTLKVLQNQDCSEIHAVQSLLKTLALEPGQWFSLDALHSQKETVRLIVSQGHHYLIGVKRNQPTLYRTLQTLDTESTPCSCVTLPLETSHGHTVERTVKVYEAPGHLQDQWANLRSLIVVHTKGTRDGEPYEGTRYFISDAQDTPQEWALRVREHWRIENSLHWVKDVTLSEDEPPRRGGFAPVNWAILNTWWVTLARRLQARTVPDLMRRLANQLEHVWQLLMGTYPLPIEA